MALSRLGKPGQSNSSAIALIECSVRVSPTLARLIRKSAEKEGSVERLQLDRAKPVRQMDSKNRSTAELECPFEIGHHRREVVGRPRPRPYIVGGGAVCGRAGGGGYFWGGGARAGATARSCARPHTIAS